MTRSLNVRANLSFTHAIVVAGLCTALAACTTGSGASNTVAEAKAGDALGVMASPRVVADGEEVPDGGGRYQIGKPYQVAGKWYEPGEDADYDSTGLASWYGSAFHGRLTANGEVFDAASLSAAHPTLPLPSYVRVTNLANDRSIVVRVNDRGPYSHPRLIDVSERVADILDFRRGGTAPVRVQYVDKARLDGDDDSFLLASYQGPETGRRAAPTILLASASKPAEPSAVVLTLATPPDAPAPRPAVVAFAEPATPDTGESAIGAVGVLSESYPPDARIAMAFELVSDFDQ